MYRILLFDADDTIFDFKKAEKTALELAMLERGYVFKEEYVPLYSEMNIKLWERLERGEITKPELIKTRFRKFLDLIGEEGDSDAMHLAYETNLSRQGFMIDGARELLKKLSENYRIALITNGLKFVQNGRLDGSGIRPFLENVFISEEVGYEKPDRRFFDVVRSKMPDFKAEEALVIGDSLTSDILGGNNAVIDTVWFNLRNKENNGKAKPTYEIHKLEELLDILK